MLFTTQTTALLLPLLAIPLAHAHGFVHSIKFNNDRPLIGERPSDRRSDTPSIIRQIRSPNPNVGADNPAMNCGPGAFRARDVADVQPGARMEFDWRGGDLSRWPHNTGPMITYLASCGNTPCSEFDSSQARWFKIHQVGKKEGNNRGWVQGDLMEGAPAVATLPSDIAPGHYLIRHEIIALHLAQGNRGAEFYPACAQIRILGSGTGRPREQDLVSFPGAYRDDDPGIRLNPFGGGEYDFPGPPIARLVTANGGEVNANNGNGNSGANNGGSNTNNNGGKDGDSDKEDSTTSSPSKKKCRLKKVASRAAATAAAPTDDASSASGSWRRRSASLNDDIKLGLKTVIKRDGVYPKHVSRVMRRLLVGEIGH